MAPHRPGTRNASSSTSIHSAASPTNLNPAIVAGIQKSSIQKRALISAAQKQALIDNLQLEITERARKLRAQCALQAQALRTRLEIRVHRIPVALRKTSIGDLMDKYAAKQSPQAAHVVQSPRTRSPAKGVVRADMDDLQKHRLPLARGVKRSSVEMNAAADKENTAVSNPKKRVRTTGPPPAAVSRTTSRRVNPSQVLSPKSNNSRTLPRSPHKQSLSPVKPANTRPVSPLKPLSADLVAPTASSLAKTAGKVKAKVAAPRIASRQGIANATTSAGVGRPKRGAQNPGVSSITIVAEGDARKSDVSNATSSSAGTTIVTKVKKTKVQTVTTASMEINKSTLATKFAGIGAKGKKVVGTKVEKALEEAPLGTVRGGRMLRKRA